MTATTTSVRRFFPFAFAKWKDTQAAPSTPPKRYERQIFSLRGIRLDLTAESGRAKVTAHILTKDLQKLLGKDVLVSDDVTYDPEKPLAFFDAFSEHIRSLDSFLRALHELTSNPYLGQAATRQKDVSSTTTSGATPATSTLAKPIPPVASSPAAQSSAIEGEYLPSPVKQPPGATKYKAGTLEYQNADQHPIFGTPKAVFVGYVRAHGVKEFSKTTRNDTGEGAADEGKPVRYPCYHIALELTDGSVEEIQGQSLATTIEESKLRLGDLVILRQFSSFTSNERGGRMKKKQFEFRFPSAADLQRFQLAPKKG